MSIAVAGRRLPCRAAESLTAERAALGARRRLDDALDRQVLVMRLLGNLRRR
jgi:hypothetical protein